MGVIDSSVFAGSNSKERARTSREWNANIVSLRLHLEEKSVLVISHLLDYHKIQFKMCYHLPSWCFLVIINMLLGFAKYSQILTFMFNKMHPTL
jgi:hypothetical protein